jgi:Ca2+-binding RTX toxin-like protein
MTANVIPVGSVVLDDRDLGGGAEDSGGLPQRRRRRTPVFLAVALASAFLASGHALAATTSQAAPSSGSSARGTPFSLTRALADATVPLSPVPTARPSDGQRARIIRSYERLPLAFEHNRGQAASRARYVARGAGYGLALTSTGVHLALASGARHRHPATDVSLTLRGAHPAKLSPSHPLPGDANYLIGRDRSRWVTDVEEFSCVTYHRAWPGIDALIDGHQTALRYDFLIRPGADPDRIAIGLRGASGARIDRRGRVVLSLDGGRLLQDRPVAFQRIGGERRRVAARYELSGRTLGIRLGSYDHSHSLFIDPTLDYSTFLGGLGTDTAYGIAVDSAGSAYVTGTTSWVDFPTTPGAFQTTSNGGYHTFVTKFTPDGSALSYSTYLGAGEGHGVAVDSAGSAYVYGFGGVPTTPGAFQTTSNGNGDVFVAKLNPDGSDLDYGTYLGGSGQDAILGAGIKVDSAGSAYVTGQTNSDDFPTTPGAFRPEFVGGPFGAYDGFVSKLTPDGSDLDYSTYLGGASYDEPHGIAIDSAGSAYVAGYTGSGDFPITAGALKAHLRGADAFVTKLNPTGSALSYSTYLGGPTADAAYGLAVDSAGSAYVIGFGGPPPTPGAFQTSPGFSFVSKLNPTGSALSYSSYLGGGNGTGHGIAVDSAGAAYVTGFAGADFPTTANALQPTYADDGDAFLTKVNPTGSALDYSTYLGGNSFDRGYGIALDSAGSAYITGETESGGFPTTPGAFQPVKGDTLGHPDGFVTKLSFGGEPRGTCTITGTSGDDTLVGTGKRDTICGLGGNDVISGQSSNDHLLGGDGNDVLTGGGGDDVLDGGPGRDRATYSANASAGVQVNLATGIATAGSLGTDTIVRFGLANLSTIERVDGSQYNDTLTGDGQGNELNGRQGNDTINGGAGDDIVTGEAGNDMLTGGHDGDRLGPGSGDDNVSGGRQSDTLRYVNITGGGVSVHLAAGVASGLGGSNVGTDTLAADIENVVGSPGNDVLDGHFAGIASSIDGGDGSDDINTSDSDALDSALGGAGADTCTTDAGDTRSSCP